MNYPEDLSHMKHWLFKDEQEISDMCLKRYNELMEKFKDMNLKIPKYLELEKTMLYFCYQLVHFCEVKMLKKQIIECAVILYNRFYLKESILIYDPRILIFTCIILAIKIEGLGRQYKLKEFFSDIDINIDKVLEHENIVCSSLNFELNFLYTKESAYFLKIKLEQYIEKYIQKEGSSLDPSFESICERIYKNTTNDCVNVIENFFIAFTFAPSQIALYCFVKNIKIHCNIVNTDKFILELITNGNQIMFHKLKNKLDDLHVRYKKFLDVRNKFDEENTTKQIGETLDMCIDIYDFIRKKKSGKSRKTKKRKTPNEDHVQNGSSENVPTQVSNVDT